MTLRDWLQLEQLTVAAFAAEIGRSPEAVRRYATGERIPDRETMPLIALATRGEVLPNDFFGLAA